MVVEAFKARLNAGREPRLYFWQDSHHNEVDLVFERQRNLVPIEIKSSMTWHPELAANLLKFQPACPTPKPDSSSIPAIFSRKPTVMPSATSRTPATVSCSS